jgi:alpha-ketoglutarate-dependent taurine dioxygenase
MHDIDLETAGRSLATHGWAVLHTGTSLMDGDSADQAALLRVTRHFGTPSSRDGGKELWPVRPCRTDPAATVSERAGAATFHTDAAYRSDPEHLICLFVVRPATEGGETLLLGTDTVTSELRRHSLGQGLLTTLAKPVWRWQVPEVFRSAGEDCSPAAAVLAQDGGLRWRADNLAPGLTREQRRVAAWFASLLRVMPGVVRLEHRIGDLILIDNHQTMHARAAFRDPRRLLLRARLWTS